jgi:hypothetical protein
VGDFVNAVSTSLQQGLSDAFALIKKDAPETITAAVGQGDDPWFAVATAEKASRQATRPATPASSITSSRSIFQPVQPRRLGAPHSFRSA